MATAAPPPPDAVALFGTDLRLEFDRGSVALARDGGAGLATVSGLDNLVQALSLRLLVDRGDLAAIGHPRYGSRIRDLIGESNDRANRELLRRYVRRALLDDPRVQEVVEVVVSLREQAPDSVVVQAVVTAIDGSRAALEVAVDAG